MNTNTRRNGSTSTIVSVLIVLVLCAASVWLFVYRQYAVDQLAVWRYEPSAEVKRIAQATTMQDAGEFYFYASSPAVQNADSFNEVCKSREHNDAILGCYTARKIYIYNVNDERLTGVREVTAAHEMLHAAYERLDGAEKARIDKLLDDEYQKLQHTDNKELQTRMEYYARTEPGERNNELHSIIGTEVGSISSELESYYTKYFASRAVVVKLAENYTGKFQQLQTESESLKKELEALAVSIDSETRAYNADISVLNADIGAFNARADRGDFANGTVFAAERSVLATRVSEMEARRAHIDEQRASYEQKRQAYNATADEANSLTESLNSNLEPAPRV